MKDLRLDVIIPVMVVCAVILLGSGVIWIWRLMSAPRGSTGKKVRAKASKKAKGTMIATASILVAGAVALPTVPSRQTPPIKSPKRTGPATTSPLAAIPDCALNTTQQIQFTIPSRPARDHVGRTIKLLQGNGPISSNEELWIFVLTPHRHYFIQGKTTPPSDTTWWSYHGVSLGSSKDPNDINEPYRIYAVLANSRESKVIKNTYDTHGSVGGLGKIPAGIKAGCITVYRNH